MQTGSVGFSLDSSSGYRARMILVVGGAGRRNVNDYCGKRISNKAHHVEARPKRSVSGHRV